MSENIVDVEFVKVEGSTLIEFLQSAENRIIIAKAGYWCLEIETLVDLAVRKKIECKVYVDPGENAVRWGFGQREALKELNENRDILQVQTANHIRIAVVIVDDRALIYAPVALSWEIEPNNLTFPNGFFAGPQIARALLNRIDSSGSIPKVVPFPGCSIPKKAGDQSFKEISETIDKLEKNPPVDPSRLRKMTVYRNNYKLLRIEMRGTNIRNKSVGLRPINCLLPDISERLKASWRVFSKDEIENIWQLSLFRSEIAALIDKYTLDVKRFGYLIKTEDLDDFRHKIATEKIDLLRALKQGKNEQTKNVLKYLNQKPAQEELFNMEEKPKAVKAFDLKDMLDESKKALAAYYLGIVVGNPEAEDSILSQNRALRKLVQDKNLERKKAIKMILSELISDKLRFPEPDEMIENIDVKIDPFDVSDELLYESKEFRQYLADLRGSDDPDEQIKIRRFSDAFEVDGADGGRP